MPEADQLWQMITTWALLTASVGYPPVQAGAFWILVAFYGVISVFFDDETPRGIPGIEEIYALRPEFRDNKN
jgi:hypothetical protein